MYIPFSEISNQARIWIYQADRPLTEGETLQIQSEAQEFLNAWGAHGHALQASLTVQHEHFIIVAVDNAVQLPTGCSIDQSVHFIRNLGEKLKIDFFNRTQVSVWENNSVLLKDLALLKKEIGEGTIPEDTLIFNNLLQSKAELAHWKVPIKSSWLGRYFTQKVR